jgi:TM2 domain-containing membrane protein YozV
MRCSSGGRAAGNKLKILIETIMMTASTKAILPAFILCILFGVLGFHRFYMGKPWTGILYLLTGGLFSIGVIYDIITLVIGIARDGDGNKITEWL